MEPEKIHPTGKGETSDPNRPIVWCPAVSFRGVKIPMFVATFWLEFVSLSPQNFPSIRPSNEVPKLSLSIPNLGWNGMGLRFMQYVCNIWLYTVYTIYIHYMNVDICIHVCIYTFKPEYYTHWKWSDILGLIICESSRINWLDGSKDEGWQYMRLHRIVPYCSSNHREHSNTSSRYADYIRLY